MTLAASLHDRLALLARQSGRRSDSSTSVAASSPACAPLDPRPGSGDTSSDPRDGTGAQPAAALAAPATAPGGDFAQRMARFSLRAQRFTRPTDEEIADRLGGTCVADGLIEIGRQHPLDRPHGRQSLLALQQPELTWLTGEQPHDEARTGERAPRELVFIDTETTGLAGGSGTLAFLVGIARVRGDTLVLTQWLLTRFGAEPALLDRLAGVVAGTAAAATAACQGVTPGNTHLRTRTPSSIQWVSFNGKSFDLPLLSARCTLARRADPLRGLVHHDLLHPTRTAFGRIWPDCRLQTAEQRLLGVERIDDLPGHRIPAVWADFVQFGDASALGGVVEHNRIDLLSLAALLPALTDLYRAPAEVSTTAGAVAAHDSATCGPRSAADAAAIARMQLRRRRHAPAQAHLAASEAALDERALLLLAQLHRRSGDWVNATRLWQRLAERGVVDAIEALAKYHEHVSGDLAQAAALCVALREAAPAREDFRRRQQRIESKRGTLFSAMPG